MSKPDDIPQDIWDAASEMVGPPDGLGYAKVFTERCARAIVAERERCARVADNVALGCRAHSDAATSRPQRMASSAQAFVVELVAVTIRGVTP